MIDFRALFFLYIFVASDYTLPKQKCFWLFFVVVIAPAYYVAIYFGTKKMYFSFVFCLLLFYFRAKTKIFLNHRNLYLIINCNVFSSTWVWRCFCFFSGVYLKQKRYLVNLVIPLNEAVLVTLNHNLNRTQTYTWIPYRMISMWRSIFSPLCETLKRNT